MILEMKDMNLVMKGIEVIDMIQEIIKIIKNGK
jgi:hypothetical protein